MAGGKILIGGTAYTIKNGKTLINGTAYKINKGKTIIGGTAYTITLTPDPINLISGTSTPYSWTATSRVSQSSGSIQWGAYRYDCVYWSDGNPYAGRRVTITCSTTFDLTRLSSFTIRYSFDQGGETNGLVINVGNYSTTLSNANWTLVTKNCGAQTANSTISFSWYEHMSGSGAYNSVMLCVNSFVLNFT